MATIPIQEDPSPELSWLDLALVHLSTVSPVSATSLREGGGDLRVRLELQYSGRRTRSGTPGGSGVITDSQAQAVDSETPGNMLGS